MDTPGRKGHGNRRTDESGDIAGTEAIELELMKWH
jgi:hypothetical protein